MFWSSLKSKNFLLADRLLAGSRTSLLIFLRGYLLGWQRNSDAADMPPPRDFPSDVCFANSTGSTPAKQKRARLSRNSIVAQLLRRPWFPFRLNDKNATKYGSEKTRPTRRCVQEFGSFPFG